MRVTLAIKDRNQILCSQSADFREGMAAFLEKRPPQYRGS
jgi:enoyl-CoA hydratase/carnithine racemase